MVGATNGNEATRQLLCLTTFAYKKPDMSYEDYHKYISEFHVPLSSDIMAKYGVVKRLIAHNHNVPRTDASIIADPFPVENFVDYDVVVTTVISDVGKFEAMKEEPYWKEKVIPDWKNFADTKRTQVTVGWIEERIRDGVVL